MALARSVGSNDEVGTTLESERKAPIEIVALDGAEVEVVQGEMCERGQRLARLMSEQAPARRRAAPCKTPSGIVSDPQRRGGAKPSPSSHVF